MVLGDSTLEYLTPSANAPLDCTYIAFVRWKVSIFTFLLRDSRRE